MGLSQRRGRLIRRLHENKTRAREALVLVEGVKASNEAIAAGADVSFAVVSPRINRTEGGRALRDRLRSEGIETLDVNDAELRGLSATEHPQGVLVVCLEPSARLETVLTESAGESQTDRRLIVLDAIQDPGNVGTLVRSAVAFGFHAVVALDGTGDPWGAKAVRASAGMVFRLPVVRCSAVDAIAAFAAHEIRLLVASSEGARPDFAGGVAGSERPKLAAGGFALVLGNEGSGVRAEVRDASHETVAVAMSGRAESLNVGVAGSVLMYELTR